MDNNLRYSRQFILTDSSEPFDDSWKKHRFSFLNLYTHPLLDTNYVKNEDSKIELLLIGYIFDCQSRGKEETEILLDTVKAGRRFEDISLAISKLSGRFVLLLIFNETTYLFNDPGGLRSVYYSKNNNKIFIGSQPAIFSNFFELAKTKNYYKFIESDYYKKNIDFSLPSGVTLFKEINHLLPNHYLNISTLKQHRYWPVSEIRSIELEKGINESSRLFSNLLFEASRRFDLSLPLTAGYDSRTILSFCKPFVNEVYTYTLKYRNLNISSNDIRIPKLLTRSLNISHSLLDCHLNMDAAFLDYYSTNTDLYHSDWAKIAYGLYLNYPNHLVALKGACSEIVKCWYQNRINKKNIYSGLHLSKLESGWEKFNFIVETLDLWINDVKQCCLDNNLNILDLFVWEHRIGTWQANCQLEWDIVQEVYSPFNTRPILELMLGIDPKYRHYEKPIFLEKLIENSWKELNVFPVNPIKLSTFIKNRLQTFLTKRNLYIR